MNVFTHHTSGMKHIILEESKQIENISASVVPIKRRSSSRAQVTDRLVTG